MEYAWWLLQGLFIILFPFAAYKICKKNKVFRLISPVVICYLGGILLANVPGINISQPVSEGLSEVSIPLAVALVVFSLDLKKWFKHAGKAAFSFLLCLVSALASSLLAVWVFKDFHSETWKLASMSIGVYTGGTPNMSAIGKALAVDEVTFVLMNASDVVLGGVYLIFLMSFAHPLLSKVLPAYESNKKRKTEVEEDVQQFNMLNLRHKIGNVLLSLLMGIACLAAGVGVSILIFDKISIISIILTITTLAVLGSFIKAVRTLPGTFEVGEYLLLIFCVAIGTMVDINQLFNTSSEIFYFMAFVMGCAIAIHYLLAIIFRIDADTLLITSVAGIYGPAFVLPIASVIRNKEIVITGLSTGILGYAVANYLGLLVAYLLNG
jgi:uncharacterized membrane protein